MIYRIIVSIVVALIISGCMGSPTALPSVDAPISPIPQIEETPYPSRDRSRGPRRPNDSTTSQRPIGTSTPNPPASSTTTPIGPIIEARPPVVVPMAPEEVDTAHARASNQTGTWEYEIKSQVNQVITIRNNGTETIQEIDEIPRVDILLMAYVLLPENHWFIADNPFESVAVNINQKRPVIWTKEFEVVKRDHNSVMLRVKNLWSEPVVKDYDPALLFPNFDANLLGSGGQGSIYRVSFDGIDYALKEGAREYENMERLFFTKGVLEIYGYFKHQNKIYMLMPLAQKSLKKAIADNDDFAITEDQVKTFAKVLRVSANLRIENSDVKPANIVLTSTGPKLIDISGGDTRGYSGSTSLKLLQSILEGLARKDFKRGKIRLADYYEYGGDIPYRDRNVASPEYMKYFYEYFCRENNLVPNCDVIQSFKQLYPLLSRQTLRDAAEAINQYYSDNTGTIDQTNYGIYRTGLDFPQLKEPSTITFADYFARKETIIRGFCGRLKLPLGLRINVDRFFEMLVAVKPTYVNRCEDDPSQPGSPRLLAEFKAVDDSFKEFVMDAFLPQVQYHTFKHVAKRDVKNKVFKLILEKVANTLGIDVSLKNTLQNLLK